MLPMTTPKRLKSTRNWAKTAGFVLAAVCSAGTAKATGEVDVFGPVQDKHYGYKQTEQEIAFEVRFGPYLPELPNQTGAVPSFGDQLIRKHRVMVGFEADWQALRVPEILSLGPGAGVGYTSLKNWGTYNGGRGDQLYNASLKVFTQWVWAVLRVDVLQQKFALPFVFYGKLGAARASWWSNNRPYYNYAQNVSDSGSAQGLAWAAGAMFDLGCLDPDRAQRMDTISGVNHMYLFWEWYKFNLNDFGSGVNQVGDSTWALGWAMDM